MKDIKIGDKVFHKLFKHGTVVRLNISGSVVKFDYYQNEMCCPDYTLEVTNENKSK